MKTVINFINEHKYISLLVMLIVISSICQLYKIDRDFNGLHEFGPAQYSLYARNLLEYGFFSTRLAPACNINPLTGNFLYFLHSPFFTVYVYALFFKIFGCTILMGRLISILFFSLGTICLYLLILKLWSKSAALWTCFFYMFFPVSQYFGKFVSKRSIAIPLIILFLLFYYLWIEKNKLKYFYLMLASFAISCATSWFAYYLAPLAILHCRYILKSRDKRVFALLFIAVFSFFAFFLFNYLVTGSFTATQSQWPANFQASEPSLIIYVLATRMRLGMLLESAFYIGLIKHLLYSFTFPAILVVLYFLFNYSRFQYLRAPTIYIFFLPALYLCHMLIFPSSIFDHIFMTMYLSVAFALSCALIISKLAKLFQVLFVAIFLIFSTSSIKALYGMNNTNQDRLMLGKVIPAVSCQKETVAVSEPFYSPFIEYFGQRQILYDVTSWKKLHYIIDAGKIDYFITNFKDFQGYLMKRVPAVFLPNNYIAFKIKAKSLSRPTKQYNISFNNNLNLIDYSWQILPQGYLLLEYGWEKTKGISEQLKVFVHFQDGQGKYLFGQDHFILNGFADMTKPGYQLVKENYIIKVPEHISDKQASVYIGLYSPVTRRRVKVTNVASKNNRVSLGQIKICN